MAYPVNIDDVRVHYDFSDAGVIADLRRLAACGMSDLGIARYFGYKTAPGMMAALGRPENIDGFRALYEERARIEAECLAVIGEIRDTEQHPQRLKAAQYLLERVEGFDAKAAQNVVAIERALAPDETRARLTRVRDMQRAG